MTRRDILAAVLALPEEEREVLVHEICRSFHQDDDEFDDEYIDMINQRVEAVEQGEPGIPIEEVFPTFRHR